MAATTVLYHGAVIRVEDMILKFAAKYESFRRYVKGLRAITEHWTQAEADKLLNDIPDELAEHFRWNFNSTDLCFEMKIRYPGMLKVSDEDHIHDRISCHDQGKIGKSGRASSSYLLNSLEKAGDPKEHLTYHLGLSFEARWRYHNQMQGPTFDVLAAWATTSRQRNPKFRPNLTDEDYQPFLLKPAKDLAGYNRAELLQDLRNAIAQEGMPSAMADEYLQLPGDQGMLLIKTGYGHVYSKIIHPRFQWSASSTPRCYDLLLRTRLPESIADSLIGKPISDVVQHPLLDHIQARITGYDYRGTATRLETDLYANEEILLMPWSMTPTIS